MASSAPCALKRQQLVLHGMPARALFVGLDDRPNLALDFGQLLPVQRTRFLLPGARQVDLQAILGDEPA